MQNIRKQFPVLQQGIYADTAASGLLYDDLLEWRQEHDLDFLIGGSGMKFKSFELVGQTRYTIGDFFNTEGENVSLLPNFSIGLNLLLEGLNPMAQVLLLEGDYPSVNWPFENRGFPITYVPMGAEMEAEIHQLIDDKPISVLALSLVQWINGLMIAPEFLKKLKEQYPELLIIVDGTQYCGAFNLNFDNSGIDVLGASGYKWLLGGYGNGFFIFSKFAKSQFRLQTLGFNSVSGRIDKRDEIRFTRQLEPGHLDSFNFGSLKFSLEWMSQIGMKNIEAQNKLLLGRAKEAFSENGLLEAYISRREHHGTIFSISKTAQLLSKLTDESIIFSERGGRIRLSFHFYNTEEEVNRIIEIVKSSI